MIRRPTSDIPQAAYAKAVATLDEFAALTVEYAIVLDAQRAMVGAGDGEGAAETLRRGDALARAAEACGRRLAPCQEALATGEHTGPRAQDLASRLTDAAARGRALANAAARLEGVCAGRRSDVAAELARAATPAGSGSQRAAAYAGGARPAVLLDKHG